MDEYTDAARDAAVRVAAGATWLDIVRPGWDGLVVLDTLDMTSPHRCILGQVFDRDAVADVLTGYTWARLHFLGGVSQHWPTRERSYALLTAMGFDADRCVSSALLDQAWGDLIEERRAGYAARRETERLASLPEDPATGCIP